VPDQTWPVSIAFTEQDTHTRADAVLELSNQRYHGVGQAKRAPGDPSVPVIGQELAAARALADLSHALLQAAADRIEGGPVQLHD
jgi:hypothetical protein